MKTIKTKGYYENATVPLHHIATSGDYNWGAGANNHRFAFLITDEDIDLTKDTPTKEATLKALQDAGISLTVVGETAEKKDFDPLVNGTNGLYLDIDKNFADLLNVQFANKVVETVQKGRVFKVQTDKYELISKLTAWRKQNHKRLASKHLQHRLLLLRNRLLSLLRNRPFSHRLKMSLSKQQFISHQLLFLKRSKPSKYRKQDLNCFDDSRSWSS